MPTPRAFWRRFAGFSPVVWALFTFASLGIDLSASSAEPDGSTEAARDRFFEQSVRPVLAENCYSCHGDKKQKGGLRLDSLEAILAGGDSGPAVVPAKPDQSLLVEAINYHGLEMPPVGKLEPGQIAILTRWVSTGAHWPARDRARAHAVATGTPGIKPVDDRPLWSLAPLRNPSVPEPSRSAAGLDDWDRNPVDRFILKSLLENGLSPAPEADRATLIRRLTFDLTGLPPTPEQIESFVNDDSIDAYERLVDRLLASPRYGERWGRHWLDLVRYAESDGFRLDSFRPEAWRYRDYVVRAFNTDKPYDRFVAEQIAGDEVDHDDIESRVATGYLRLGTYEYNQRNVRGQWADILNEITDVTGEVFLGLSIACARCHDHKFDPISQKDYYRLQAFFTPLLPRDDLTVVGRGEVSDYQTRLAAWEKQTADTRRQIAEIERPYREKGEIGAVTKLPADIQQMLAKPESARSPLERQLGALAYRQVTFEFDQIPLLLKGPIKTRWEELHKAIDRTRPAAPAAVLCVTDVGKVSPPTLIPGERKQAPIEPGILSVLDPAPLRIDPAPAAPHSTGRRLALVNWLNRPDNPLTTRVIVNRVWQYHFGRGLVATASDLGRLGEAPSHPALLDWLATEFVASGRQFKRMHRLIVTSATYRQAARRPTSEVAHGMRIDAANRLVWKRTVQRLDAEEIRDAMLAASGELEPAMGGQSVPTTRPRRTIDTRVIRNTREAFLDAFDAPDGTFPTSQRVPTTTATQALLLINGEWTLARAKELANRLERMVPGTDCEQSRVELAYWLTYGRAASGDEIAQAMAFIDQQSRRVPGGMAGHVALVDFCHALLNSNEFLYVD